MRQGVGDKLMALALGLITGHLIRWVVTMSINAQVVRRFRFGIRS